MRKIQCLNGLLAPWICHIAIEAFLTQQTNETMCMITLTQPHTERVKIYHIWILLVRLCRRTRKWFES